jgi:uncharacterized protein YdeI (YjbR/CyaY-like superfamily)
VRAPPIPASDVCGAAPVPAGSVPDMDTRAGLPVVSFESVAQWQAWLEANHAESPGVWIKIAKAGCDVPTVTYPEALDIAICFGWIDGQKGSVDDMHWLQKFTRRGPRSKWSKVNRQKATALIGQGRMRPAGLAEVERAQQDGRWDAAYDSPSTATVPDDLQRALDSRPKASAFFATLNSVNRYAMLYRIQDAKRAETRARRIEKFVTMLDEGRTLYP